MRLLVSVRSAAEAESALAGGADIIDAKDPSRGALGAVDPVTLRSIAGQVPAGVPLSVALGDMGSRAEVEGAIRRLSIERADGLVFLKLGFAGIRDETVVEELLGTALGATAPPAPRPTSVAVAYADHAGAGSPTPGAIVRAATRVGAGGVLLDTWVKDGRNLFHWMTPAALSSWIAGARAAGLLVAVAGSLGPEQLTLLDNPLPDIVGVRGAACLGGRGGQVDVARVCALRSALDDLPAPQREARVPAKRETRARGGVS
jgi:(5-formylfuran-3-yl)methyl phosphate synthase